MKRSSFHRSISLIVSVMMLIQAFVMPVFADTKNELKKDAEANQKKLDQTQQEIADISSEKENAEAEMEASQEALVQLLAEVEILKQDIVNKQAEIEQAQADYEEAKRVEERQYNTMRARIRFMYENNAATSTEYLDIFLHAESISDAINKAAYAEKLYEYDRTLLMSYINAKEEVAERQRILEEEMSELEEVEADLLVSQEELNRTIEEQRATVENFSAKLAAARSQAKAYQKKIAEDNEKIAKIVAAEKEAAKRKAAEEARKKKLAEEAAKKAAEEAKKNGESSGDENSGGGESGSSESEGDSGGSKGASSEGEPVSGGTGSEVASYAKQFVGNPYVPGGTSLTSGCDCSGFVWAVYNHPRRSDDQGRYGKAVDGMENARPGDIFYYVGHVGIYLGNGYIVHASTPATGIKITAATYRTISSIRRIV